MEQLYQERAAETAAATTEVRLQECLSEITIVDSQGHRQQTKLKSHNYILHGKTIQISLIIKKPLDKKLIFELEHQPQHNRLKTLQSSMADFHNHHFHYEIHVMFSKEENNDNIDNLNKITSETISSSANCKKREIERKFKETGAMLREISHQFSR